MVQKESQEIVLSCDGQARVIRGYVWSYVAAQIRDVGRVCTHDDNHRDIV